MLRQMQAARFWLAGVVHDLRHALRGLRRQPTFAAAAIFTLALGVGANSAVFAVVDAILLRPLPFPQAERVVAISERTEAAARGRVAPLNLADWNTRSRAFAVIGGYVPNVGGMV